MNSITDYVYWYADFSFYEKPFNEVDNFVLSNLAYYSYELKKDVKVASLRRCVKGSSNDAFLNAVKRSVRFGSLQVSDYVEVFDRKKVTQFAAVKFRLTDKQYYVAFRGTDNSLVGWREDFMISYKQTAAQLRAVEYLENVMEDGCTYIVGGHSKGGNLALYGCCYLSDGRLSQVSHIYNNDGPGLCPEVSDLNLIEKIKDRTTVFLPQFCIFGKIFAHDIPDTRIVSSFEKGINQHDVHTWGVERGKPDVVGKFTPDSKWINEVVAYWIKDISTEEREKFVGNLFDSFEGRGAKTREEAMADGLDGVEDLLKNMVESDTVKTAAKIPEKALFGDFFERLRTGKLSKLINANQLIEGIILAVVGALMLIFPNNSFILIIIILLGAIVAFQFFYTLRKLYDSKWNFEQERARVYIFVAIATVFCIILVKEQAVFIIGSLIAGCWLLVTAYKSFIAVKTREERDFTFYKKLVKTILYLIAGVFILVAPIDMLRWFVLGLGALMVLDGASSIVYSFIQANEKYSEKYANLKEKVTHHKKKG